MDSLTIKKLYFKDTSFAELMRHRIYNVLLYASKYDAFTLEEDGRIDEQIFKEYTALNLRYAPRFTLVSTEEEANEQLKEHSFELIISMPSGDSINPFEWAKQVKKQYPQIPIVVLTPFSKAISQRIQYEDLSAIDYVFSWLGNSDILLAIIKLLEDKMNVREDVESVGVQTILVVEDSIHFYSSLIPRLYKYVFTQSRSFMTEALNDHEQMLRMRGRPKILLARNYEEATEMYEQYKNNMLGIITDVNFPRNGEKEKKAGIRFATQVREHDKYMPIIIQSTEEDNHADADNLRAAFISKSSSHWQSELHKRITENFGFGDFIFKNPNTGAEELRVSNLKALQDNLYNISDESLLFHVSRNDISRWLYSRAMFPLAEFLKHITLDGVKNIQMNKIRDIIWDSIAQYRRIKNRGVIAEFHRDRFDHYSNFARMGDGSMGGKGRGLAFIDAMIKRNKERLDAFENTLITIPKTVILSTDKFTEFMENNQLYSVALSDIPDEEILQHFLRANLSRDLLKDLDTFLETIKSPVAVRSSSLLEDSHYQPFAGIYSTYMVPYDPKSRTNTLMMVAEAVKAVYASVFYKDSKAYMKATQNVIDEEKMAIVLQEICGNAYENRYYPSFSGVASSLNYYPIGSERTEEGVANIAMGLGKYIVDGGSTLRFSPSYPQNVLQTSTIKSALRETQTYFNALDLSECTFVPQVDDSFNLLKIDVKDALKDGTLQYIASTYNYHDEMLYDNIYDEGRKVITFANILKHNVFPLADILKEILQISQSEMGRPIEIEFAVNLDYSPNPSHTFYLLQIRPIADIQQMFPEDIELTSPDETILFSNNALGHGITDDIYDLIYVKPECFNAANNNIIASEIERLNNEMIENNRRYILIGPGRWGSSDSWLGIPVKWPQISNACLIVESGLSDYRIDPSQGTHFFQNLTSFGVSYFTINPYIKDGYYDIDYLNSQPALHESEYLRVVRFENPLTIKVDGRKNKGVLLKPEIE